MKVQEIDIKDLKFDKRNANKGKGEQGQNKIRQSIKTNGLGRSIVISNDNVIAAGNHITEGAISEGIKDAIIVESDGTKLVIVKRTDIESGTKEFYNLAISDNTTAKENIDFDFDVLDSLMEDFDIDVDLMPDVKFEMPSDLEEYRKEVDNTKYQSQEKPNENGEPIRQYDKDNFDQSAESYLNSTIRQIVLYYDNKTHLETLNRLEVIMRDFDIEDDNSETVLKLIDFYEANKSK
jgi:hypothetical protein